MNDDVKESYFAFEYRDDDGKTYYTRVTGNDRWTDVLEDFVRFLEGIYKYGIKDQIRLEKPLWADFRDEYGYYDPWQDHYFEIDNNEGNNEEDEEDEDSSHPGLSG